uniref:Uncharacterized protein n=1 Tax=Arundo donax TaxID=35708 RepID=A0A0A9HIV6_ARUDO
MHLSAYLHRVRTLENHVICVFCVCNEHAQLLYLSLLSDDFLQFSYFPFISG